MSLVSIILSFIPLAESKWIQKEKNIIENIILNFFIVIEVFNSKRYQSKLI